MNYLIDTCCISELVSKKPESNVLNWFEEHDEFNMFLSVITLGELRKGIEKLTESKKKRELNEWVNEELLSRFRNRILNISQAEVNKWGEVLAKTEKAGNPLLAIDALIASTALVHDLSVVTRNTKDMEPSGVELINPWVQNS